MFFFFFHFLTIYQSTHFKTKQASTFPTDIKLANMSTIPNDVEMNDESFSQPLTLIYDEKFDDKIEDSSRPKKLISDGEIDFLSQSLSVVHVKEHFCRCPGSGSIKKKGLAKKMKPAKKRAPPAKRAVSATKTHIKEGKERKGKERKKERNKKRFSERGSYLSISLTKK